MLRRPSPHLPGLAFGDFTTPLRWPRHEGRLLLRRRDPPERPSARAAPRAANEASQDGSRRLLCADSGCAAAGLSRCPDSSKAASAFARIQPAPAPPSVEKQGRGRGRSRRHGGRRRGRLRNWRTGGRSRACQSRPAFGFARVPQRTRSVTAFGPGGVMLSSSPASTRVAPMGGSSSAVVRRHAWLFVFMGHDRLVLHSSRRTSWNGRPRTPTLAGLATSRGCAQSRRSICRS
jgi:hypothetical protein